MVAAMLSLFAMDICINWFIVSSIFELLPCRSEDYDYNSNKYFVYWKVLILVLNLGHIVHCFLFVDKRYYFDTVLASVDFDFDFPYNSALHVPEDNNMRDDIPYKVHSMIHVDVCSRFHASP